MAKPGSRAAREIAHGRSRPAAGTAIHNTPSLDEEPAAGPRLIFHANGQAQPTLDPRLAPAVGMLDDYRAQIAELQGLRERLAGGEVDPSEVMRVVDDGFAAFAASAANLPTAQQQAEAFITHLPAELVKIRWAYMKASRHDRDAGELTAVPVQGNLQRGLKLGYFKAALVDNTWGALQRRPDDCLQAAIATFLQTPAHTVPDLNLGSLRAAGKDPEEMGRVIQQQMGRWLEKNAVTIRAYPTRLPASSSRWIGVVDADDDAGDGVGNSHCVLMQGREIIFDTAWLTPPRKNEPLSWHRTMMSVWDSLSNGGNGSHVYFWCYWQRHQWRGGHRRRRLPRAWALADVYHG